MISIIIPLYNKEKQIAATLQSVFNQTFQDFEVIIVNDGSTDSSVAIVESFGDSRLRLINQQNSGVSAARNRGVDEAKGEFIAFLDADDEWKPEYLETQMSLVGKYPQCDVFATNYEFIDETGKVTSTIIRKLPFQGETGIMTNYFEVASCSHPPLWTSAIIVRRDAILAIGGFPVGIKSGEDLLTWARLACRYKIAYSRSIKACFIFDETIFTEDQRNRAVSISDEVGKELKALSHQYKLPGMRQYIALWYKMRGRIYLNKGNRSKAIKEIGMSMCYNINAKILCFLAMCILPNKLIHKLFNRFG